MLHEIRMGLPGQALPSSPSRIHGMFTALQAGVLAVRVCWECGRPTALVVVSDKGQVGNDDSGCGGLHDVRD